jgi:DNA mismatch repair ATPase MutS
MDMGNGYKKRIEKLTRLAETQDKYLSRIANLRMVLVAAAAVCFFLLYRGGAEYAAWGTLAAYTAVFIYLIVKHRKAKTYRRRLSILKGIDSIALKRLMYEWKDLENDGAEFKSEDHPFSGDLDLYGRSSLFQLMDTTSTWSGKQALREVLESPSLIRKDIEERQQAAKELSRKHWFCQRLQLSGLESKKGSLKQQESLIEWAKKESSCSFKPYQVALIRLLPALTILSAIAAYGFNVMPSIIFKTLAIAQAILLFLGNRKRGGELQEVYGCKEAIKDYGRMLYRLEKGKFSSEYLKELQSSLMNSSGETASCQIRRLEKISDNIANRGNLMFLPINILLLWDYQCAISLGRWKIVSGAKVEGWIGTVGSLEALCSLGSLSHDHPKWCFPKISDEKSIFKAENLGHPLLGSSMVRNTIAFREKERALLITGSNMSGKSTLMRTCGISLAMAYAGAPVCAYSMECSIMRLCTCMRIGDNLEKSISSFYAELLRIKDIVQASREDRQVFFLLDEIFKGTNSSDRHTGAKQVMLQLIKNGAMGMVSTHDLELGDLEKETKGSIKNYHFEEQYKDGVISFDYKLREGVSTTRNALYLIRMAGIEINEI